MSGTGGRALARSMARRDRLADLLPDLHQRAVNACGGSCSVLLTPDPQGPDLIATSAFGLDHLDPDPWFTSPTGRAAAFRAWETADLVLLGHLPRTAPETAKRLKTSGAMLVPLVTSDRALGLLVIGVEDLFRADAARDAVLSVADLLTLVLERARLQRHADFHSEVCAIFGELSRTMPSSATLPSRLEGVCLRVRSLVGAERVSVWLHHRRARRLRLVASSDPAQVALGLQVRADDLSVSESAAMRRGRAELRADEDGGLRVLAPLTGRRRALGTLIVEGMHPDYQEKAALTEQVTELARQLSSVVENVWLLEDALRARREIENTFNSLADLVAVCDRRLRLVHVNHAFAARFARRQDDMFDRPLQGFVGPALVEWLAASAEAAAEGQQHVETREIADPVLRGTFAFTLSPLLGSEGEPLGMVLVARDVTEQARMEAERTELRSRLAQSEKLAALGQVIAGIAHEMNNPLQGVMGHLELVLATEHLAPAVQRDLRLVFREADRAAKIVHSLLVFAGSRRIARRRLNLNLVLRRALSLRSTAFKAQDITIVLDLEPRLPKLVGDALLLQQALLNILMNAEQAVVSQSARRAIHVTTRADRARRRCSVVVADTGPGIPPDALPRLFEPFFTTKDVGQGTGLGLAIAYGIVQEHGGRIIAANGPEGGAVFTIDLPFTTETASVERR